MVLTGKRTGWEEFLRRKEEGVGLKDDHVEAIRAALAETPADVDVVDIDAALTAMRQVTERTPTARQKGWSVPVRGFAAHVADSDESWWLHRSRTLGLTSIVPVEPWPRDPEHYVRPPGYLHNYGPEPPAEYVEWLTRQQAEFNRSKAVQEPDNPLN
jgi:hypothetical protein